MKTVVYIIMLSLVFLSPAYGQGAPKPADAKESKPAVAAPVARTPLITITFDRRHVYFEKELRQAIMSVESTRAGTSYDVVSVIPAGATPEQNRRFNNNADANLDAVLVALNDLGVSSARVDVSTESSDKATAQEVNIYTGDAK